MMVSEQGEWTDTRCSPFLTTIEAFPIVSVATLRCAWTLTSHVASLSAALDRQKTADDRNDEQVSLPTAFEITTICGSAIAVSKAPTGCSARTEVVSGGIASIVPGISRSSSFVPVSATSLDDKRVSDLICEVVAIS